MAKLDAFTTADLVKYYAKYRADLEVIAVEAKMKGEKPNKMLAAIEGEMVRRCSADGLTSLPAPAGTFTLVTTSQYNLGDPLAFQAFVLEKKDTSYFNKAVSKQMIEAYVAETGALPPGITRHAKISTRFTKKD